MDGWKCNLWQGGMTRQTNADAESFVSTNKNCRKWEH